MRIDLYTKVILTVIALSLSVIAFKDTSPIQKAFASSHSSHEDIMFKLEQIYVLADQTHYFAQEVWKSPHLLK